MSRILLIQGSLSSESKTAVLIRAAADSLQRRHVAHEILDLRSLQLEFCDGRPLEAYNADMQAACRKVEAAQGLIFGMPVYCFSVSGALKNFIDISSGGMENKTAAILCNAGGNRSYMAIADLSKILAFESRVVTVQPSVYTSSEDYDDSGNLINDSVRKRIEVMLDALLGRIGG